jgi:hypothetical protein
MQNGKAGILLAATMLLGSAGSAQQLGLLSGVVTDDVGTPVRGALVLYSKIRDSGKDHLGRTTTEGPGLDWGTRTGPDGRFLVAGLPEGDYYLCAIGTLPNHLRTCEWGGQSTPVHLGAGQSVAGLVLVLRTGTVIDILVRDPNSRVTSGRRFAVGVMSDSGIYSRAKLIDQAGPVRRYVVTVPKGASVRLFLDGPIDPTEAPLDVRDDSGRQVATRRPSLPISVGQQSEATITVNIQ